MLNLATLRFYFGTKTYSILTYWSTSFSNNMQCLPVTLTRWHSLYNELNFNISIIFMFFTLTHLLKSYAQFHFFRKIIFVFGENIFFLSTIYFCNISGSIHEPKCKNNVRMEVFKRYNRTIFWKDLCYYRSYYRNYWTQENG